MQITLSIARFNPLTDAETYMKDYLVEWEPHETVLDLVLKAWQQDPALSFRRSCRSSICGSCAMFIEDRPRLACQTLVKDLAADGGRLTLKPLPGFRQLKDLVVDLDPFFEALRQVIPWILTVPGHNGRVSPEDAQKAESPATCVLCAICDAGIESQGNVSPAALVKNMRMVVDPRDALGIQRMKIAGLTEEGLQIFRDLLFQICPKKIEVPHVAME
ncbi:MAG: succinate dehydrogenase/fumarate reductase iron-sulfur subunit [Bacillota bacterium]